MNILIVGVQGSGKGTQAKRIAAEYGLAHIATGEMFRAAIGAGTPLGREVEPYLSQGLLVPDELTVGLIRERLDDDDAANGFILDGFPRNLAQADALDEMLREVERELDIVFELQIRDEVAAERLRKRAAEEGRADDTPDAIERRIETYHRETAPVVERYRTQGIVVGIHGERSINEVFAEIQQALDHLAVRG